MQFLILFALFSGVFAAPFVKEEEAKGFIRLKRQSGYWDPHSPQNQWGYTVQEQLTIPCVMNLHNDSANEYWTAIRTDAQYYMDMSHLMFDRSVAGKQQAIYGDAAKCTSTSG
ncbi:uncharacterized protein C3orf85-like isoform X2 [Notolabrus celidotus]|nr:uncharacterized protein C3orf85-like isoform X2 [Notolabrus celidotus]